jgi:hypothetical protein
MAWRFRRSIKIIPGFRLNISKRGVSSISVGGRGATLNVGKRGVRQTIGIPGTGLSFTSTPGRRRRTSRPGPSPAQSQDAEPTLPRLDLARFNLSEQEIPLSKTAVRTVLLSGGALLLLLSFRLPAPAAPIAIVSLLVAFLLPSGKRLEARESERCQALARSELNRRRQEFNAAREKLEANGPSVHALLTLQTSLGLEDDELGFSTIERLKGLAALFDYEAVAMADGGRLPKIAGHDAIVAPGACHFVSTATYDKRGDNDPSGSLFLSSERLIFVATEGLTTADWDKVMSVEDDERVLRVQRRDRKTPYLFLLPSIGDAMKAKFIARNLVGALTLTSVQPAQALASEPPSKTSHVLETTIDLGTGHGYTIGIVRESYRQTALRAIAGDELREGKLVHFVAMLTREPENIYDPNAIRINAQGGDQLGYLSREDAIAYREVLIAVSAQSAQAVCSAKLVGGTPTKPSIGVVLDLRAPNELVAILQNGQPF